MHFLRDCHQCAHAAEGYSLGLAGHASCTLIDAKLSADSNSMQTLLGSLCMRLVSCDICSFAKDDKNFWVFFWFQLYFVIYAVS